VSGVDRAIRASTAAAVLGVAVIAAYLSYEHAYAVVRAHGETGMTARLEPATIDGLVYSSSMVILYAARHRLPVPALARWLLGLGIAATLAANVAHGWSHGPIGAVVAAWPAASLVGSYELLLWIIRTNAARRVAREPAADHLVQSPGQPAAVLRPVPAPSPNGTVTFMNVKTDPRSEGQPPSEPPDHLAHPYRRNEPGRTPLDQPCWATYQVPMTWPARTEPRDTTSNRENHINAAAVSAYRASLQAGAPLSERMLAQMFGKTSRR
jgi:Protein of unknown function (DUF2637)